MLTKTVKNKIRKLQGLRRDSELTGSNLFQNLFKLSTLSAPMSLQIAGFLHKMTKKQQVREPLTRS